MKYFGLKKNDNHML